MLLCRGTARRSGWRSREKPTSGSTSPSRSGSGCRSASARWRMRDSHPSHLAGTHCTHRLLVGGGTFLPSTRMPFQGSRMRHSCISERSNAWPSWRFSALRWTPPAAVRSSEGERASSRWTPWASAVSRRQRRRASKRYDERCASTLLEEAQRTGCLTRTSYGCWSASHYSRSWAASTNVSRCSLRRQCEHSGSRRPTRAGGKGSACSMTLSVAGPAGQTVEP